MTFAWEPSEAFTSLRKKSPMFHSPRCIIEAIMNERTIF